MMLKNIFVLVIIGRRKHETPGESEIRKNKKTEPSVRRDSEADEPPKLSWPFFRGQEPHVSGQNFFLNSLPKFQPQRGWETSPWRLRKLVKHILLLNYD